MVLCASLTKLRNLPLANPESQSRTSTSRWNGGAWEVMPIELDTSTLVLKKTRRSSVIITGRMFLRDDRALVLPRDTCLPLTIVEDQKAVRSAEWLCE